MNDSPPITAVTSLYSFGMLDNLALDKSFWRREDLDLYPALLIWGADLPLEDPMKIHIGIEHYGFEPEGGLVRLSATIDQESWDFPLLESEMLMPIDTAGGLLGLKFLSAAQFLDVHFFQAVRGMPRMNVLLPAKNGFATMMQGVQNYRGGCRLVFPEDGRARTAAIYAKVKEQPPGDFTRLKRAYIDLVGMDRWKRERE